MKLYIDLQAEAVYIETDGNDIMVDTMDTEWTTHSLVGVLKPENTDSIRGIELLHIDEIEMVGQYGSKTTWHSKK
jgi:hypothetical protein